MNAPMVDWNEAALVEHLPVGSIDGYTAMLTGWFGERACWPDGVEEGELARWMLSYPDPTGSRLGTVDDHPMIREALASGVSWLKAANGKGRQWINVLDSLSQNPDARRRAASRSTLADDQVRRLIRDPSPTVRAAMAANTNYGSWVQVALADDPIYEVRLAVVRSSNTPPATIHAMVGMADMDHQIASRQGLPVETFWKLIDESWTASVKISAISNLRNAELLAAVAARQDLPPEAIAAVGRNISTSPATLADLALRPEPSIRAACASNSRVGDALAAQLAKDPHRLVVLSLLMNRNVSQHVFAALADHEDETVANLANKRLVQTHLSPQDFGYFRGG